MGFFPGKRILDYDTPDINFSSGTQSDINPNGSFSTSYLKQFHNIAELPRLHSEIAALQNITNSIHPNYLITSQSPLDQRLQQVRANNPNVPLRVKFYIRNSAYPPCMNRSTQPQATCNNYLNTFIYNFKRKYAGIDARMKVASPKGIIGTSGNLTENTRVRYGYGQKDGKWVKRVDQFLEGWVRIDK
jgi:hypothetical protein